VLPHTVKYQSFYKLIELLVRFSSLTKNRGSLPSRPAFVWHRFAVERTELTALGDIGKSVSITSSAGSGNSVIASIDANTYYMSPVEDSDQARCAISERAVIDDMRIILNL
jgi:hypothetical protein